MWTFTHMDFLAFGGSYPSLFLMRLFQGKFDVLKFYRQFDISKSYLSDKKIQPAMNEDPFLESILRICLLFVKLARRKSFCSIQVVNGP